MQQILNNILKKSKKLLNPFSIGGILAVIVIMLWVNATMVSANILPVVVNVNHLDFGTVFPGEIQEGSFIVTYATTSGGVYYRIVQERKPLPSGHPDYPDGGDPAMPGYYKNLCPFLTKSKSSVEEENDTEILAFVGPDDVSDTWIIYFKVPAIFGNIAQGHIGGVVDTSGEYGCDISVDVLD